MPSVTCLRLSDVSVICRVTYFQFQFSLLFFHILRGARGLPNIGHRTLPKNVGLGFFVQSMEMILS